ncbi:hypothetical protein D3C76_344860 [compost metagenome]
MKYCVVKDTTIVIDGSNNPSEIMIENALNAGYSPPEVEILTEDEYKFKVELQPAQQQPITEINYLLELDYRLSLLELGLNQ